MASETGTQTSAAATDEARAFVEAFDVGWRRGGAGFVEHFLALADEDVLLTQPLLPAVRGHDGFRALFEPLFAAMPDLHGEVRDWTPEPGGVTIELAVRGTLDGLPVAFTTRDRIVLRDGKMLERHARFSPLPLLHAALRRPRKGLPLLLAPLRGRR